MLLSVSVEHNDVIKYRVKPIREYLFALSIAYHKQANLGDIFSLSKVLLRPKCCRQVANVIQQSGTEQLQIKAMLSFCQVD